MDTEGRPSFDASLALFDGLPVPTCLVATADGRLVAMNRRAVAFWGVEPSAVVGRSAMQVLGIVPSDGDGDAWERISPPGAHPRLRCRITTRDGKACAASLLYAPLDGRDPPVAALFVVEGATAELLADLPEWALRDPVTGLGNRHAWARELPAWSSRSGCAVFLDLDDLKEVNDLHGHLAGDRLLAATGQAIASVAPSDALVVRYGGDEFVAVLPEPDEAVGEAWAQRVVRHVASAAASPDLAIVPRLSHGVAAFGPGGLDKAVQRADDVLYERKGVLLSAASGGRIILTREGRAGIRGAGDDRGQPRPGAFGAAFGPEFEEYFRVAYAHAMDQAREFVAFVAPEQGSAVVEVGAGSGRIAFDGGLAARVGSQGQLLLTDPSGAQLQAARKHAEERGLGWVRFLRAPAEDLPLASGTADLVLGAVFLHFTDPVQALREMSRILRPGGRLAICAGRETAWPGPWLEVMEPIRRELESWGLPFRHPFLKPGEVHNLLAAAGLTVERTQEGGPDRWAYPSADLAVATCRQLGLVSLLLRGVPAERHAGMQEEFDRRVRVNFSRYPRDEWAITTLWDNVVARKAG